MEDVFKKMENSSTNSQSKKQSNLKASVWQDQNIDFYGEGPIIINAAYFPDWRSQDSNQEIYQVTPGQMLVFADGATTLKFSASTKEKASGWISVVSIVLVISTGVYLGKKKKNI